MDNQSFPSEESEQKIEVIVPEAIVEVRMDTGYYRRVQDIVSFLVHDKNAEQLKDAHAQITSQVITEPWVQHYETVLILCKEFEQNAKNGGHTKLITEEEARQMFSEN